MNKKIVIVGAVAAALMYFITPSGDGQYVESMPKKEAPEGYSYTVSNNLYPNIEAKTFVGNKSFRLSMRSEKPRKLYQYGLGFTQELDAIQLREKVISNKGFVQFYDRNNNNQKIVLTPPNMMTGLIYSSRIDSSYRNKLDMIAYGALSKWFNTEDPVEIATLYFGEDFANASGFKMALLDFQKQIIVSKYKLHLYGFSYQSVAEEFNRIMTDYIAKDNIPPKEVLSVFEAMVMNNVKSIADFAGSKLRNNKEFSDFEREKVAMLLVDYFIYEDVLLLNSLKSKIEIIRPASIDNKIEKRLEREEQEARMRQQAEDEEKRSRMLYNRTGKRS